MTTAAAVREHGMICQSCGKRPTLASLGYRLPKGERGLIAHAKRACLRCLNEERRKAGKLVILLGPGDDPRIEYGRNG